MINNEFSNRLTGNGQANPGGRRRFLTSTLGAGLFATVAGTIAANQKAIASELQNPKRLVRKIINPWSWGDSIGIVQGNDLSNFKRIFIAGGQASVDAEGQTLHPGDMRAQCSQAFDNLETLLGEAGYSLSDVMRITFYTTDVDLFQQEYDVIVDRLQKTNCQPASALIGVARLTYPDLLFEMEATAIA